jgi:hypothetical protein
MASIAQESVDLSDALVILGPDRTDLLMELDRTFVGWGNAAGPARSARRPSTQCRTWRSFDVYTNFPI